MVEYPQQGKQLFIPEGEAGDLAYIAWGDIPTQFYGYITGFKNAADSMVLETLEKGQPFMLDTHIFPICFLYRQYLELVLKYMYLCFSKDNIKTKQNTIKDCSHDLNKIWFKARSVIDLYFLGEGADNLDAVEDYIKQFADEDKSSFNFRYPITKALDPVHDKKRRINLRNLAERIDELAAFFDATGMALKQQEEIQERQREAEREFEREMQEHLGMDIDEQVEFEKEMLSCFGVDTNYYQ